MNRSHYRSPYRRSPYRRSPYRRSPYRRSPYRRSPYKKINYRSPYRSGGGFFDMFKKGVQKGVKEIKNKRESVSNCSKWKKTSKRTNVAKEFDKELSEIRNEYKENELKTENKLNSLFTKYRDKNMSDMCSSLSEDKTCCTELGSGVWFRENCPELCQSHLLGKSRLTRDGYIKEVMNNSN